MNWKIEYRVIKLKEKLGEYISCPKDVINALKNTFDPISEEMYILIFDTKNQIIEKHLIAKGGYNTLMMKPAQIFRKVLITGGDSFIIAHNHPSGDVKPSEDDIVFTKKVLKGASLLGINFLDHIIYCNENHYSFKKENLL